MTQPGSRSPAKCYHCNKGKQIANQTRINERKSQARGEINLEKKAETQRARGAGGRTDGTKDGAPAFCHF